MEAAGAANRRRGCAAARDAPPWPLADHSVLLRWLWDRELRRRNAELYQVTGPSWELTTALIRRFAEDVHRAGGIPALLGELAVPGYSAYLHPLGDGQLLGVGVEADPATGRTTGLQASVFDLRDLARPTQVARLQLGEGLIGQCALDGRRILITEMPDGAVPITSGLFQAKPRHVIVLPVLFEVQVKAVIELASLQRRPP